MLVNIKLIILTTHHFTKYITEPCNMHLSETAPAINIISAPVICIYFVDVCCCMFLISVAMHFVVSTLGKSI